MFWEALIWGVGVSLGMNVGLFVMIFTISAARKLASGNELSQADANKQSLAELVRRNEISEKMAETLVRLADTADEIRDNQ